MAADKSDVFYIELEGIKYGWRAPKDSYKGLDKSLGVKKAKDKEKNIVFGADNKPPRVRINLDKGSPLVRFCDPDKIKNVVFDNELVGKKFDGRKICSVRVKSN